MRNIRRSMAFGSLALLLALLGGCFLLTAPPTPQNLSASDGEYVGEIVIRWDAARGATHYEVFRATSEDGDYEKIGETKLTRFSDDRAFPNVMYWYRVRACNQFGCSPLSQADSGYHLGPVPPQPPETVQASDGTFSNKIRVIWAPSVGATYYELYRSDVPAADFRRIAQTSGTSHDDQEIVIGRTYYYKVKACNNYGCSDFSETDAGFAAASAPGVPQNVQASDGTYSNRVRITWSAVSGAAGYEVHRATSRDGTYELIGESTGTSYDDTAVTPGTTYWYKVRAWNALGYGPFSEPDSGYASTGGGGGGGGGGAGQVPGQVQGVSASDGAYPDKIRVTWNSVSGAQTYRVYRSPTGIEGTFSQIAEVPSGTTSYDDTTVTVLCQEYWYAVSAWNNAGEGPLSVPDSGYMGTRVTGVPTVSASQGTYADKIVLTWNEVSGPTPSIPVVYEVQRAESYGGPYTKVGEVSEAENADTNTTVTYEDKVFTGNYWEKTFYYRVKACAPQTPSNVCGCGGFSAPVSGYVSHVPAAPTNVSAVQTQSTKIEIRWDFTPRSGETVTFAVYRASAEAGPYTKIADGLSGSPYVDAADTTKTWWYKVQACNSYGCGPLSAAAKYTP